MKIDEIRVAMHASPFVKFTLHLANGRKLKVAHPDFITTAPSGRSLIVYKLDDSWEVVDVPLINSLEFHPGRNGRKRKAG